MKYNLEKQYSENKLTNKISYERSISFNLKRVVNSSNFKKILLNDRNKYYYLINQTNRLDKLTFLINIAITLFILYFSS